MRSTDHNGKAPGLAGDGGFMGKDKTADSRDSAGTANAGQGVCLPELRSDLHRVGAGLAVRFSSGSAGLEVEWTPRPPTKRELKRVGDRYRAARDQFLQGVATALGGSVAVIEAKGGAR